MLETGCYHLVGAAGTGMNALAQALLATGCEVSASDRACDAGHPPSVVHILAAAGVTWHLQDGSGVTPDTRAVVVSTAIEAANPDSAAAARLGIPVRRRGEVLAALVNAGCCVAVAGTSGKSTVTGMLGWILEQAGRDPTVINGAPLLDWSGPDRVGNVRSGRSDLHVVEADESDRSLLYLHPALAVITNISGDHFPADEACELFGAFAAQVSGRVFGPCGEPCLPPDFAPVAESDGVAFDFRGVPVRVPLPGRHNAENAWCALIVAEALGVPAAVGAEALGRFRGIARRLERVGDGPVPVYDDFAHNPAKIRAAWTAVAPREGVMRAVWRPHGYGPLRVLFDELVATFATLADAGDRVHILPVYDAGGTADRRIGSAAFVEAMRAAGVAATLAPDYDAVCAAAAADSAPGCVWLVMGARDPDLPALARRLDERLRRPSTAVD